jgi:Tol biopolymer transport system component
VSATRRRGVAIAVGVLLVGGSAAIGLPVVPVAAADLPLQTRLVSRDGGGAGVDGVTSDGTISGNGRFVAFLTATALDPSDTNGRKDVYVRDRWAATTELVSVTDDEKPIDAAASQPSLSDDGRYVAFLTKATNLIPGDTAGFADVFVRDRYEKRTIRVASSTSGGQVGADTTDPIISGNGRHVAFVTTAGNVVANDTNGVRDVFVRDLSSTTIARVSLTALGAQPDGQSWNPSISDDGQRVAFSSLSPLAGGLPGVSNVYLRDRTAGTTELVNVKSSDGTVGNAAASNNHLSGDGTKVAFASAATDLVAGDSNGLHDAFVRDLVADTTVRVSLTDTGAQLARPSMPVGMDRTGERVLFDTNGPATADDIPGSENYDVFLRDVPAATTRRITTGPRVPDPGDDVTTASVDSAGRDVAFSYGRELTDDAPYDQTYVNGVVSLGPFGSPNQAIVQQYQDFLGRAPTTTEVSTWSADIASERSSLPALEAKLLADPTFAAKRAPLARLYWAFFLRRPDTSGLTFWLGKYQRGSSLTSIAQSFARSTEFTRRYGNVGNRDYVKLVYQNVFERQPDPSGLSYWTAKLDSKALSRGAVIVQFSESSEGKRRLAGPTNITLLALAMLRRTPNATEWTTLYETVRAGEAQPAWIARTIMDFAAYQARFS